MRTDIKTLVRNALISNTDLIALLGGERIYHQKAASASEYPRLNYFEVVNSDSHFADDKPYASDVVVQIDVFSKGSTSAIAGQIDKTMKEQGWTRSSAPDYYEEGTGVFHKAMRYRNSFLEIE